MISDKIIENTLHVKDILRNISKTQALDASVVFSANEIYSGVLYYYRQERQLFIKLKELDDNFFEGREIKVSFLLKETLFSFSSRIINITENVIELIPPSVFTSSFKRHYSRYIPSNDEKLTVKMPDKSVHDVKDITINGLAFNSPKLEYNIGERIRNIEIPMESDLVKLDAVVKYIIETDDNSYFYGLEFTDNDWFSHYSLFQYIFSNTYPEIRQITDYTKEEIFLLYDNSNYFKLKPWDEIQEAFNKMVIILNQIKDYPQIISNPVFVHNNKMIMGASALRIYNRTFLAQHLAALPESRLYPSSKQSIYLGITDYLICNPYYDYYLTYYDAKNKWHNRMYGSIAGYINDDTKYLNDTVDYFELYKNEYIPIQNNIYQASTMNDKSDFCEFAQNNLPVLIRKTYGYDKENIDLNEIKQVYELIGIYAARSIIEVTLDGKVVAYAVCEAYTAGLNLYNVLDLIHIMIADKNEDINAVIDSIINEAMNFYNKYNKNKFNVFVQLDQGVKDSVSIPGLRYDFLVGRCIVDRDGIVEYKNLILNMTR